MKVNAGKYSTTHVIVVAAAFLFIIPCQSAAHPEICKQVTHRQLCEALTKGSPDTQSATVAVAEKLIQMTNRAKSQLEAMGPKTDSTQACIDNYNLAIQDLSLGMAHVNKDKFTFIDKVNSAVSCYSKCDAANSGVRSSMAQLSERLSNAASTCLEIAKMIS